MHLIRFPALAATIVAGLLALSGSACAIGERNDVTESRSAPHGRPGIEPPTAEAWVKRILTMRAAGDDDAADREVVALHARYPDFVIPTDALGKFRTR